MEKDSCYGEKQVEVLLQGKASSWRVNQGETRGYKKKDKAGMRMTHLSSRDEND